MELIDRGDIERKRLLECVASLPEEQRLEFWLGYICDLAIETSQIKKGLLDGQGERQDFEKLRNVLSQGLRRSDGLTWLSIGVADVINILLQMPDLSFEIRFDQ